MKIELSRTIPTKEAYLDLHDTTGWNAKKMYTVEQLYSAISNSWQSVSVYHEQKLIGFGRIISDGIYQSFICDVMVHPDYQQQGIGTKIIQTLVKECRKAGLNVVQLFCAKGKQDFYKKLGFCEREAEAPGMTLSLS